MRTTYVILHACLALQALGMMEHPACAPWQPAAASTWRLPLAQSLSGNCAILHQIDECSVGARSKKHIALLAVAFPRLSEFIASHPTQCQCPRNHTHTLAVDKDELGVHKTAPLKQYPEALCKCFARAFHVQFGVTGVGHTDIASLIDQVDECAASFFCPLYPYCEDQMWDMFCHDCAQFF